MNRELIIPNMHVILIHYPLGVLFTGVVIELLSIFWRRHSVRVAGHWMVLIGGLATIPTALSGIYALHDVAVKNPEAAGFWKDTIKHAPLNDIQWQILKEHVLWGAIGSGVVSLAIVGYLGLSDRLRKRLYFPVLAVLLFGCAVLTSAAWHGGEAVYRHGVAIEPRGTAEGEKKAPTEPGEPASQPAEAKPLYVKVNTLFPPVQFHLIMAGIAVAIALGSVGVACRRITGELTDVVADPAESLVKSLEPQPEPVHLRPGKMWLVAMLFFILTALGGWYVLGSSGDTFKPKELWSLVVDRTLNSGSPINRRLLHVIVATLTILLPLLLAAVGRWAPKQKFALIVLTLLLVLAIAAQVWLGVLLLFDTPVGPVVRFN